MLSDLTLIIPTLSQSCSQRLNFLKKLCLFYSENNIRIIVVDGSVDPLLFHVEASRYSSFLLYIHMPPIDADLSSEHGSYYRRLCHAVQNVSTKYAMIATDDDLFLPEALSAFAVFLDEDSNSGYSGVVGMAYKYIGKSTSLLYQYPFHLVSGMTPIQRFLHYLPFASYALCRTEILVSAIKVVNEYSDLKIRAIGELIFEITLALAGGIAFLPIPFWVRGTFPKRFLNFKNSNLYEIFPYPYEILDPICKQIANAVEKTEAIKVLDPHALFLAYYNIRKPAPKITSFQLPTLLNFKKVCKLFVYRLFWKTPVISSHDNFDYKLQLLRSEFASESSLSS